MLTYFRNREPILVTASNRKLLCLLICNFVVGTCDGHRGVTFLTCLVIRKRSHVQVRKTIPFCPAPRASICLPLTIAMYVTMN